MVAERPPVRDELIYRTAPLRSRDGLDLHAWTAEPTGQPRAAVLLVHGYAEHSGRYLHVAEALAEHAYAVQGYDHRGFGCSGGERGYIRSFRAHLDDLGLALDAARARWPGLPVFVVGHSMGGMLVALHAIARRTEADGIVLSAAASSLSYSRIARLASPPLRLTGRFAGRLPMVRAVSSGPACRDEDIVRAYAEDPLVYRGPMRVGTMAAFIRAFTRIERDAHRIRLPSLLLHGTADTIIDVRASRRLYERLGSPDKALREYPGLFHELFNEPERDEVLADMIAWLDERCQ